MKPLACYTVVRNETTFLPMWLRYYSRVTPDLYVLDHDSDDGSTTSAVPTAPFTRIPITSPHVEDVTWMKSQVEMTLVALLREYQTVIFTEADEFLIPDAPATLAEYARYADPYLTATGYDVCENTTSPLLSSHHIFGSSLIGRSWKRNDRYDKTLICRDRLSWEIGFHKPTPTHKCPPADPHLLLLHFHYADRETAWDRLQSRQRNKTHRPGEGGWSYQNKPVDREAFDREFDESVKGAIDIPEWLTRTM